MDGADTPGNDAPKLNDGKSASFFARARHRLKKLGAIIASVAAIGAVASGLAGYWRTWDIVYSHVGGEGRGRRRRGSPGGSSLPSSWRYRRRSASASPCITPSRHPSSPQLVAVHDGPRTARHVVQRAALHQCVDARFAEQDERGPIVIAARITGDLPALSEQLADGQRRLVGGRTGRCEHRCKENA
jgi:hypothetical protein